MLRRILVATFLMLGSIGSSHGQASNGLRSVDTVLVLAVDISGSVTDERWEIQKSGYISAFRSKAVQSAIVSGGQGAIAVTFVQWSNPSLQIQNGGWFVIDDRISAETYADMLSTVSRISTKGSTAISNALLFASELIRSAPFQALRRIIDISGDGKENDTSYFRLAAVRDTVLGQQITINGLPILGALQESGLVAHYQHYVVGGPGSFVEVIQNPDDAPGVARSIQKKLVREIAMLR